MIVIYMKIFFVFANVYPHFAKLTWLPTVAVSDLLLATRKKFIHEKLPNNSETEDMRKIR